MIAYLCSGCSKTFTRFKAGQADDCPNCSKGFSWLTITHADGIHKQFLEPVRMNRAAGPDD